MKDPVWKNRYRAALRLGQNQDPAGIPALESCALNDENEFVREGAVKGLMMLAGSKSEPIYIAALKDVYSGTRRAAARALMRYGDYKAVEPLIETLKDTVPEVLIDAANALETIGDHRALGPLLLLWHQNVPQTQPVIQKALNAIRARGRKETRRKLKQEMQSTEFGEVVKLKNNLFNWLGNFKVTTVEALGETMNPQVIPELISALRYGKTDTRRQAAACLLYFRHPRILQPLITGLMDMDETVRRRSSQSLATQQEDAVSYLAPLLSAATTIRSLATHTLAGIGKPALPSLLNALSSPNPIIRREAAEALGYFPPPEPLDPLINTLNDKIPEVRLAAVEALGRIGTKDTVEPLLHCLNDPHTSVVVAAADALGAIGDIRAVEPLHDAIKYETNHFHIASTPPLMRKLIALGKLGDTRAVEPLLTIRAFNPMIKDIKSTLENLIETIPYNDNNLFCTKCLCRAVHHKSKNAGTYLTVKTIPHGGMNHYACRNCHSNIHLRENIDQVRLILDNSVSPLPPLTIENNCCTLYYAPGTPFPDIDVVHIKRITDMELDKLIMSLKNDADAFRRNRLKSIAVFLPADYPVSPSRLNLMRDTFKQVSIATPS